ncbi:hypothetical protein ACEOIB_24765 [Pseudomonas aeruginosa]
MKLPTPPRAPLCRMISLAGSGEFCPRCHSSMMRPRFIFFGKSKGCIHPECENFGGAKA